MRAKNEEEELVARDNLKIKTLAKYKTLKDGDIKMYQDIENKMIDLAICKGKCFDDSSMEEMEHEVESDFEKRDLNKAEMNFGRRSENSELHESIRSSHDYWQEVENKYAKHKRRDRTLKAKLEK